MNSLSQFGVVLVSLLGLLNFLRIAILLISADIYDVRHSKLRRYAIKNRAVEIEADERRGHANIYEVRPLVSVVIPAHNEELVIHRSVCSVLASTYKNIELIVIDDGSSDKTLTRARQLKKLNSHAKMRVYSQTNTGKAHALNGVIATKTKGSLVMVLDADSELSPFAIANNVAYFCDPSVVATAANISILPTKSILGLVQTYEYLISYRMKRSLTTLNCEYIIGGVGSMFRKKVLKQVQFYDTDTITEDIDLTLKIAARGNKTQKLCYASDVLAYTEHVPSFGSLLRQRYRWKYGRFQTMLKHRFMFFSRSKKYSKSLSWFQLPFSMFNEAVLLLEPILVGFIFYNAWVSSDYFGVLFVFGVFVLYVSINTIGETSLSGKQKLKMCLLSPLMYCCFYILTLVEYVALLRCILGYRTLRSQAVCSWQHVERIGSS